MKISVAVLKGNTLATHRSKFLRRDKPTASDTHQSPDGLGGNG